MNKKETYRQLQKMLTALLENEHDIIANLANASALLYEYLEDINWAGFYLYKNDELVLGPFQGKVACMHIAMGNGVCGTAAQQRRIMRIDNVHEFPTHIACDSASNSEIVLPLIKKNTLIGVLDIDSVRFQRFDELDESCLAEIAKIILKSI
ncbi:MAG: GAF domain-containing protein [Erysipelotrichaceae bacterium]|jgi:L-methionine (R)-S-oxide reductase|nr:GAF domain-containing protein [Erysipelotrichaceae bacterium]